MKKIILFIFVFFLFFVTPADIYGIENPLVVPNNRFGIHILHEDDLEDAVRLVNSSGGDWGYVTMVIREDERNVKRWQRVFDRMRELHLIPIVRVAGIQQDGHWKKLVPEDINNWRDFLNSLNWVVKNRYVVVGNEPNHASEWGGELNPEEYTDYLVLFSKTLKSKSDDFFILPAGLDASAPSDKTHLSETEFLKRMTNHNPNWIYTIDGWSSHSYPNPNFSGSDNGNGKGTIRTFDWELEYLKNLGLKIDLVVFITETGWAHNKEGKVLGYRTPSKIAQYYVNAFNTAWNDNKIVAVTPFVLNYTNKPFDIFSWKKSDGSFYDFYWEVRKIKKVPGEPVRVNTVEIISSLLPEIYKVEGEKYGIAYIKNTGQIIWKRNQFIITKEEETEKKLEIRPISISSNVKPSDKTLSLYRFIEE